MRLDASEARVRLAVAKAIEAKFSRGDWIEIGLETDTSDVINDHDRLLRSLQWQDPDYLAAIHDVLPALLGSSPWLPGTIYERFPNLQLLEERLDLEDFLRRNDGRLHEMLYADEGETAESPDEEQEPAPTPAPKPRKVIRRAPGPQQTPAVQVGVIGKAAQVTTAKRTVFVVHGRDAKARTDLGNYLRALDLKIIGWNDAREATGEPNPYTGTIVRQGLEMADAVVVLFTPDDIGYLRRSYWKPRDGSEEREPQGQARQNVVFEAGMALGMAPDRVVLVEVGAVRGISDIAGVNLVRLDDSAGSRRELARRLRDAGLDVDDRSDDFLTSGEFARGDIPKDDFV